MTDNAQMRESAHEAQKPGKVIYGTLRMAKASKEDMDTAYRIMQLLNSIDRGYYPSNEEGAPTFFDSDDWEHLQFLHQQICEIADNSGGVSRVIGAASVLLNTKNNLIDPDDDCIELHPDLKDVSAAGEEAEKLRARVAELEALCGELYQVAGALGAPAAVLDALQSAASGGPLPAGEMLPFALHNGGALQPVFWYRPRSDGLGYDGPLHHSQMEPVRLNSHHTPQTLTPEQIEKVDGAIAEALGNAYDCTRVWNAWSYGTMGPDDFTQVAEDNERIAEIRNAAATALGFKVEG